MNKALHAICAGFLAALVLPVAAQTPAAPAELEKLRAAYQQQVKAATDPLKLRYAQALETLKTTYATRGDLEGALAARQEIESLGLVASGMIEDAQLIIWNQNNGGKGDRGTHMINVALLAGGKEVWRRNKIRMNWSRTGQLKEVLPVPSTGVDAIRIEVTEMINDRGGLAEVELIRNGKNIAAGCVAKASAVWEDNPKHVPAKLTDGNVASYWLLPDRKTGWLEIDLKSRK